MSKSEDMKKSIIALLGKEGGRPLNKSELARGLELPGSMRKKLRETIAAMVEAGEISQGKKGRYAVGGTARTSGGRSRDGLVGKLKVNAAGHGWFFAHKTDEENLATGIDFDEQDRFYVSPRAMGIALDGDIVRAKLVKNNGGSKEHTDLRARVTEVVERRSSKVTGIFVKKGKFASVKTSDERLPPSIDIDETKDAKPGQLVAAEITVWTDAKDIPKGNIVEVLGWPGDPGVDVEAIVHQHGINATFPEEVVKAAQKIPMTIPANEIARREDWRKRDVLTIDPKTAKDFDDAIFVERTDKGWLLAVHIADVSHYVKPESVLDLEARERGNSTYLVDRVIPMLPEELSNGICSLVPKEDRLTKCVVLYFDESGKVMKSYFCDAIICTPRKYAYEEAQEILVHPGKGGKLGDKIREAWQLASLLRKRRFKNGGLDLEMPEVSIILNDEGVPIGYHREEYNESHQLIEEFMLAANEAVARKVKNSGRPTIYRVHEDPDPDKLEEFAEMARSYGYQPGDLTNRKHIQKLIDAAKGSLEEPAIKVGLLKSLKRACYLATPEGHYGLAKTDYCHFTSPIRRYADLVMHRALQPLLQNRPEKTDRTPDAKRCVEIAEHISGTERTSADAETESRRMKMLEWLELSSREDKPPVFEAIITEVRAMGLFMECTDILQRGLIKREGFPDGRWFFENNSDRFANSRGQALQAGTRLKVVVAEVDRIGMKVDFNIVEVVGGTARKKVAAKKGARKSQSRKPAAKQERQNQSKSRKKAAPRKKSARKQSRKR
jgi:ribonuclease R